MLGKEQMTEQHAHRENKQDQEKPGPHACPVSHPADRRLAAVAGVSDKIVECQPYDHNDHNKGSYRLHVDSYFVAAVPTITGPGVAVCAGGVATGLDAL